MVAELILDAIYYSLSIQSAIFARKYFTSALVLSATMTQGETKYKYLNILNYVDKVFFGVIGLYLLFIWTISIE